MEFIRWFSKTLDSHECVCYYGFRGINAFFVGPDKLQNIVELTLVAT